MSVTRSIRVSLNVSRDEGSWKGKRREDLLSKTVSLMRRYWVSLDCRQ